MPNMKDFIIPTINDHLSDIGIINIISSKMKINDQQSSYIRQNVDEL
jgi:hypothetical protein